MELSDGKGEAAVLEMTLIVPLVSLILISLIFCGIRLADRALMQSCAEEKACEAALKCSIPGYEYLSEVTDSTISAGDVSLLYSEKNPYRYLWGFEDELGSFPESVKEKLAAASLLKYTELNVEIRNETDFRGDFICIKAEKKFGFNIPGLPDSSTVSAKVRINDSDETVRNTDLALYLFDYAESLFIGGGGIEGLLSYLGIGQ